MYFELPISLSELRFFCQTYAQNALIYKKIKLTKI